jgi:predicted Zn finger-like uncharacterized protein
MLLATRCPFCETVFRLQPEQLTLRRGLVRCGHCKEVFDASSSLFDVSNGVSIDTAKRVTIDDVTAYTLETLANGGAPAPAAAPVTPAAVPVAPAPTPATAAPVETRIEEAALPHPVQEHSDSAAETLAAGDTPQVEQPSAPAHPEPAAAQVAQPDADVGAHHDAAVQTSAAASVAAPSGAEPDFRAEAWNPWAPAPDASIDRRIRHNASSIPFNPVTIPRSAQPPLTLELTESAPMDLDKAIARQPAEQAREAAVESKAEAPSAAHTEPAVDTHVEAHTDAPAEPKIEPAAEPLAHARAEPAFSATPAHAPEPEAEVNAPTPHAWREPESLREPAQPHHEPAANPANQRNQPGRAPEAPLPETFDDDFREPLREKSGAYAFDDDRTAMPSSEHAGQHREREPYFGTPSAEPDLEPRFGAGARDQFGEPAGSPFAATPHPDDDAFAVTREPRAPESARMAWHIAGGVAAGLLGCLLLVQLAWWQRETVMVAWPDSQSMFIKACSHLGCKIEPPRDIDGLLVEPSDLRQIDGPHKLELKMPLRNRFDLALAYPAVELTLLDENNNIAVRRVLWPQDYVKPGTPIAAGLPARTTQTMIVRLDTGDTVASNFRVQIFYP